jgi:hypothetical protein
MTTIDYCIDNAKLEYESDISWGYKLEHKGYLVDFYQDEQGRNHIEQFARKFNGFWFEMMPTDDQIKRMFERLNNTPYRMDEEEIFVDGDSYESTGTTPEMFF